jgi:hypothetical protein
MILFRQRLEDDACENTALQAIPLHMPHLQKSQHVLSLLFGIINETTRKTSQHVLLLLFGIII